MAAAGNLAPSHKEIKRDVRERGLLSAQGVWGSRDLIAWDRYIKELMGDEAYSNLTEVSLCTLDELCEKIVVKMIQKIVTIAKENEELNERLRGFENAQALKNDRNKLIAARLLKELES